MSEPEVTLPAAVVEALVVRPGDTLLLRLGADVTPAQFERFRGDVGPRLKEWLPDVEVVFLGGVEQMAVYRPDELAEGDPT